MLLAPLLLFGALVVSPAVPAPVTVLVRDRAGGCTVRLLPTDTLLRLQARFEAEAAELARLTGRLVADAAAVRLGAARERVPAFGDWTYDWIQSYLASWHSLGMLAREIGRVAAGAGEGETSSRLGAALSEPMREAFRARVLGPALSGGALQDDLANAGRAIDRRWDEAITGLEAELDAAPPGIARAHLVLDLVRAANPPSLLLDGLVPADPIELLHPEDLGSGFLFLRAARPMAARLGAIFLRASQASATLLSGGGLGVAVSSGPAALLGRAGGIAVYWGADWAISRADSFFNRAELERGALASIDRAEATLAAEAAARIEVGLAGRLARSAEPEECP